MANLGDLTYSLGLNDQDFNSKIEEAARKVGVLDSSIQGLRNSLAGLKDVNIAVTGIPKDVGTTNVSLVAGNLAEFKAQVESALQGMSVSGLTVDVASVKSQLQSQLVDIKVTLAQDGIQDLIRRVKEKLGIQKITVKVTPDWSKGAIRNLQNNLQMAMRNLDIKGVKVRIDREKIQSELSSRPFTAELQLKVNRQTVSESIQSAVNQQSNLTSETRKTGTAIDDNNKKREKGAGFQKSINDHMRTTTQLATILGNTLGNVFGVYQVQRFLNALIEVGGEIQKQRMALGHLLGNDSEANILFGQMKDLAVKSPFGLLDLTKNARQLTAFGVEYNNLYDTMKRLSDIAAGLGIQFGRLSLAYGETMERGFLDGKLVRQFAYMGLPVLQKIAEYYTRINKNGNGQIFSAMDVRKMVSNREVSFEDVDAVIKDMTNSTGQFYNMQEVMAESVAGKWKNLHDAMDIFYSDIAEGNSEALKMPAEILTGLLRNYKDYEGVLYAVAVALAGVKGASALYTLTMGKENAELMKKVVANRQAATSEKMRTAAMQGANVQTLVSIAKEKQLTAEVLKQAVADGTISKAEAQKLALRLKVTRQNAEYLLSENLITQSMYKQIMSGNAAISMFGKLKASMAMLGTQTKILTADFTAMAAAMLADPMTWIFAAVAGLAEIGTLIHNSVENAEKLGESMHKSLDDLSDDAQEIAKYVTIDNLDTASEAEKQTAIEKLVEFIKNNMPGAQEALNKAFALDNNEQFQHDVDERYRILKDYYDKIKAMSEDSSSKSIQDDVNDTLGEKWYNGFWTDDVMRDASDLEGSMKEYIRGIKETIASGTKGVDDFIRDWKRKYNVDSVAELIDKLFMKGNEDNLAEFSRGIRGYAKNTIAANNLEDFASSYKSALEEYKAEFYRSTQALEKRLQTQFGKDFLLRNMTDEQRLQVSYAIKTFIEDSDDSQWVKDHMVEYFKTYYNIDVSVSGDTKEAKDLMKNWFGENAGEDMADSFSKTKKRYKELKEDLKELKKSQEGMNKSSTSTYEQRTKVADEIADKEAKIAEMQKGQAEFGFDMEAEYQSELNKSSKQTKNSTDEQLKAWKKRKSMYDDMLSTYKNLVSLMSKAEAIEKMRGSGIWKDFLPADVNDEEGIKKLYSALQSEVMKSANTADRKDFASELTKKMFSFDTDALKEESQKAVSIVEAEINKIAKQYEVWKSWFNATGDSDMARRAAITVSPQWDEHSEALLDIYADKFGEKLGRVVGKTDSIFDLDMNEKAVKELFGNNDALTKAWKAIHDLIVSAGYDFQKKTADALKNMMLYSEKLAVLEKERQDALKGAQTDTQREQINSYYDNKALEMSPEYVQFMSAVTSMTTDGVKHMADAIRNNLNRQLANGVITIDKYADALKKVDEQEKKSNERTTLLGAIANGGAQGYGNELQERVNNARTLRAIADEAVREAQKEVEKNPDSVEALAKLAKAQREADQASEEQRRVEGMLDTFNITKSALTNFSSALSIATGVVDGVTKIFDDLSETFEALGDEATANWFSDASDAVKAGFSFLSPVSSLTQSALSGNVSGVISNALSAPVSMITSPIKGFAQLHDKRSQRQIDELKKMNTQLGNLSNDMTRIFERNLGGVYSFKIDSDLAQQMKDLGISTDGKSYYQGQLELLQAERDNIQAMANAEDSKKNTSDEAMEDYREQIAELDDQIQNFAEDMANTLYGLDFSSISENLASAIVSAWQQGTDAAQAYKDAVGDVLTDVAQNVLQQKILGAYLEQALDPWLESFASNGGVMNGELFAGLTSVFSGLQSSVDSGLAFMDAWEQIAEQYGYTMKDTDTSSLGASVSSVTEETADILAAYINAMRADLSIQKEAIVAFLGSNMRSIDDVYSLQESQLAQLRMIQDNTQRNADAAEGIADLLDDVVTNRKQFNIA